MIRIITSSTYAALLSDRDELARTRTALDTARRATDEADALAEDRRKTNLMLARELRDLQRDTAGERLDVEVRVQRLTGERDTARKEAGALDEVRQDVARLRAFAADPANGNAVRGAVSYAVLQDLIRRARQERTEAGQDGGLPRPLDLVALVLGYDDDGQDDEDAAAPVREEAATAGTQVCAACSTRRPLADFDRGAICLGCPAITASR
ncbi:hypothetical protein [Streptomyces sp. NBC_01439]|uniref:hypothetical protein n=1 Tax=Streptomyces sp. NBC_01439 TaxID=2903867 RepID=UPI002E2819ED|nr:hypothetical protein [Streptomyces sp. NBC_01439]